MCRKARADLGVRRLGRGGARIHDEVHGRQFLLAVTERFPDETLQAIASHRVAGCLDANRKPQSRTARFIGAGDHHEQCIRRPLALTVDGVELWLVGESARARKARRYRTIGILRRGNDQTARRLRPFARRRANTRRPPLVAMRARKPWTRLRCRLLGLKVRFMFGSVAPAYDPDIKPKTTRGTTR